MLVKSIILALLSVNMLLYFVKAALFELKMFIVHLLSHAMHTSHHIQFVRQQITHFSMFGLAITSQDNSKTVTKFDVAYSREKLKVNFWCKKLPEISRAIIYRFLVSFFKII